MNRRRLALQTVPAVVALALLTAAVLIPAAPASAHPLGNFSVNEYVGLSVAAGQLRAHAIVDIAEIPTLQDKPSADADHDGTVSAAERSRHAGTTCATVATAVTARAGNDSLMWTIVGTGFTYAPGAGGLDVSRLTCDLSTTVSPGSRITVDNRYLADRVGWREMTAAGDLNDSTLPADSVSAELTAYPQDLLTSTLDIRSGQFQIGGHRTPAGTAVTVPTGGTVVTRPTDGDVISRWMATVDRRLQDLAGGRTLTPLVGLLAVGLALLLGAGHAALPGHGKTVMAAYLAGRRGRPRDALSVAGTVTLTHTGGVLAIGLLLAAGSQLAGERIVGWLGLISAAVVIVVGAGMLARLVRPYLARHDHGDVRVAGDHELTAATHKHAHCAGHSHPHADGPSHSHGPGPGSSRGRWGLVGVGVAGGLVPSPSALVVLLAAIGLGRTAFGVLLVLAYGAGMAATLTAAGLLLLAIQRRLARRARNSTAARLARFVGRLHTATPLATAAMVLLVGLGLAVRAVATVV